MKKTGILMPVFSLPSNTGVGEIGNQAEKFINILKENGIKIWQILPLNPAGFGNSPYQPYSSYAGDEIYISLDSLYDMGLLDRVPCKFNENKTYVDYNAVREFKEVYLREAFRSFVEKDMNATLEYKEFIKQQWVYDYSVFRALKMKHNLKCWNEWDEADKNWPQTRNQLEEDIVDEAAYHMFLQFIFDKQWRHIKKTANESGIEILGDVPFYVGIDSVDVWARRENFLLDKDGHPVFIAGVPPDYFSATGQRWGNPIYDWDNLKKTGYKFWIDRIGYSNNLFDIVRIDHFRAFDTFWKIPSTCPTAVEGEWIEAPGYEVIDALKENIPGLNIVAEDLGDLRKEVIELKDHYGLKGMKVLMFCINTNGKYAIDIYNDKENMIIYTGTHDNATLMEWYEDSSVAAKRKIRKFLKKNNCVQGSVKDRLIEYVLKSKADYAIIPLADILGLGKEGHINTPGTVGEPNWQWKIKDFNMTVKELKRYKKYIRR